MSVSPSIDRAKTLEILFELQTLYFGDDEAVVKYGNPAYWEDLSGGLLTCCSTNTNNNDDNKSKDDDSSQDTPIMSIPPSNWMEQIISRGYDVLPPPPSKQQSSTAFSSTLEALALEGWPPQFLLMYNETWILLQATVQNMLGNDHYFIESDVNIWALKNQHVEAGTSYVGGNFIHPHRDMVYDACHDDDEQPTSLSVWIPLNPSGATAHNGCMRIIPIEQDDFFYSSSHPSHSVNSMYTDKDAEKLLCEQFGSAIWDPTAVHWGGSYEANASSEPRSSLAFTVRLGEKAADFGPSSSKLQTGPLACRVKDCHKGGLKRRLQVIGKSLLSYSHHWPGFPFEGFRENMIEK